jgi:hypothetical protein
VHDEKLLMYFFQDSLSGGSTKLVHEIRQHKDLEMKYLVDAFIKQYKYNMDIALDRSSLSLLEKRERNHKKVYSKVKGSSCASTSSTTRKKDGKLVYQHF